MAVDEAARPVIAVASAVAEEGFAVVRGVLDPGAVAAAVEHLEALFASEADVAEERGWAGPVHRVTYALPVKDRLLGDVLTRPAVVAPAAAVLGDDCVVAAANGLDVPPGSPGQELHRDHPVPTPGFSAYVHVVCALDPFTIESGATVVVPRSHRGDLASRRPDEMAARARPVPVGAGDAVCFDGALVHAAGPNRTARPRRALHAFFARPWVQPHWDLPASFPDELASALDERQRRLFGFGTRPRRYDPVERRVVR